MVSIEVQQFLDAGEAPIVFTLGSAAVMFPGNFYQESIQAAKLLNRRAVLLIGNNAPPAVKSEIYRTYAPHPDVGATTGGLPLQNTIYGQFS